jgi:protein-tyrosine phosphatase
MRRPTKPVAVALGIGVAGAACAGLAVATGGLVRVVAAWVAVACAVACTAYLRNRPDWLGKRDGAISPQALVVLPYLVAFRIACRVMGRWRAPDRPTQVAPGLWVSGRVRAGSLPREVTTVIDLVAEYAADPAVRQLRGYRSLPVLDGGFPPDRARFLRLMRELAVPDRGHVLIHCDSGRGRAPTFAAALLIARGLALDASEAVAWVCARRPEVALTRSDLGFLVDVLPDLRAIARDGEAGARPIDDGPAVL